MTRLARVVIPGLAHHVTQRGNRREPVFFEDDDYQAYLDLIGRAARTSGTQIWSYCLMPNHVHFVLVPSDELGLRRTFAEAHRRYTGRINARFKWTGHLWQGRFFEFRDPLDARRHPSDSRTMRLAGCAPPPRADVSSRLVTRQPRIQWLRAAADVARDWAALLYTPVLTAYAVWLTALIAWAGPWAAATQAQRLNFLGWGLITALCLIGLGTLFYQRRPTPHIRAKAGLGELEVSGGEFLSEEEERPAPEGRGRGRRGPGLSAGGSGRRT